MIRLCMDEKSDRRLKWQNPKWSLTIVRLTLEEVLLHFLMAQRQVRKAAEAAKAWKVCVPSQDDISHQTQCFCPGRNQTITKAQRCLGSVLIIFIVKVLKKFLEGPLNILSLDYYTFQLKALKDNLLCHKIGYKA